MPQCEDNKLKILVTDDSEMNRMILSDMLGEEYEIIEAENGLQAVAALQTYGTRISLVLLDIVMPELDGFGVLSVMNRHHLISEIPVIMISSETSPEQVERCYALGASDFINRPFDALIVHHRVVNTMRLYADQRQLMGMVAEQMYEKEQRSSLMIDILSHIVEFRNGESGLHVLHIRKLTELLCRQLSHKADRYPFTSADISRISTASALHDIGKIAIATEVLNKPGRLTAEEFAIMKTHSEIGAKMLEDLSVHTKEPLVKTAYEICRWHHERYDGRGYPDGLKGDEIPISAQIVALADVYDALTSERVYKPAFSPEKAVEMILNGECGAFNPLLLECMRDISDDLKKIIEDCQWGEDDGRDLKHFSEEFLRSGKLRASEGKLQLLEYEREKYNFFASMSEEVQFECTVSPSMLTISPWGVEHYGLPEIILNPMQDERLRAMLGTGNMQNLHDAIRATTPESPVIHYECQAQTGKGLRWMRFVCRASWSTDAQPQFLGAIGKAIDIHDARMQIARLKQMASCDELTGLLNRTSARARILERMHAHPEGDFALILLDLDNFKQINDSQGRVFGDHVLVRVADILRENISPDEIAVRVGGDEFSAFLNCTEDINARIDRIFDALTGDWDGLTLSVSMGIALTQTAGSNFDALFLAADQALCTAKQAGLKKRFYSGHMHNYESTISPIEGNLNTQDDPGR